MVPRSPSYDEIGCWAWPRIFEHHRYYRASRHVPTCRSSDKLCVRVLQKGRAAMTRRAQVVRHRTGGHRWVTVDRLLHVRRGLQGTDRERGARRAPRPRAGRGLTCVGVHRLPNGRALRPPRRAPGVTSPRAEYADVNAVHPTTGEGAEVALRYCARNACTPILYQGIMCAHDRVLRVASAA